MKTLILIALLLQGTVEMPTPAPGTTAEHSLDGSGSHSYRVELTSGQYVEFSIEQRGVDVTVALVDPKGNRVVEFDRPKGAFGPEPILYVASEGGSYHLEVRPSDPNAADGKYSISIKALRPATPEDQNRSAASAEDAAALRLRADGKAESLKEAIARYKAALPLWVAAGERTSEAETLHEIGFVYNQLGEKQTALEYYERSIALYRELGLESATASSLNGIGAINDDLGNKQLAIEYYNKALVLHHAAGEVGSEAAVLNNIATVYAWLGDRRKSLEYHLQALPLRRAAGDREGEGVSLHNLANTYNALGDKQKALDYLQQALARWRELKNRRFEAAALNGLAVIYVGLGERELALDWLKEALPVRREMGDRRGEGVTLGNIADLLVRLGRPEEARPYLEQALVVFKDLKNPDGEAKSLTGLGEVEVALKQPVKALEFFEAALEIRRSMGEREGEANTLNGMGRAYELAGDRAKARDYLGQSLDLFRFVGDPKAEAETLYYLARIERDAGELVAARQRCEEILSLVEGVRAKVANQQLRASMLASMQNYYELYIDVLMKQNTKDPSAGFATDALRVSERARARGLIELLAEAGAGVREGVDPALLERERALRASIEAKTAEQRKLATGTPSGEQTAALKKEFDTLLLEYQDVLGKIRQNSPRYAALTQPEPLGADAIRAQVLDANTVLVEYALGTDRSYVWVLGHDHLTSRELPGRDTIEKAARRVYDQLTARNRKVKFETPDERRKRIAQADIEYQQAALELSHLVLGPLEKDIAGKKLLIVADGALQYVPFAALPDPGGSDVLVVGHEVVSLPSASTLAVMRQEITGRKKAPELVAVVADPVFEKSDSRVASAAHQATAETPAPSEGSRDLSLVLRDLDEAGSPVGIERLPFTRREAQAIASFVAPGKRRLALDFDANRETAMSPDLGKYQVVHFATHGVLDSAHPELSGVVLSLVNRNGAPQEGFLRAYEVYNLKLPVELVVLSGCRTGLGKEVRGEGLLGLTRGFMYAGAARVVVSLWNVSDEATAELMSHFYKGMFGPKQLSPAAALRAAQVELSRHERWRSPYYWAAFTLLGEPK